MRKTIAVLLAGLILALIPSTAQAHAFTIWHGYDVGKINRDHSRVIIRDKECDGNRVYGEVRYGGWRISNYDRNGCEPGGTRMKLGPQADNVRIGEQYDTGSPENTFTNWGAWWPV